MTACPSRNGLGLSTTVPVDPPPAVAAAAAEPTDVPAVAVFEAAGLLLLGVTVDSDERTGDKVVRLKPVNKAS